MTMVSFRMGEREAAALSRRAHELGVERSELLRDAVHRHLVLLAAEAEAKAWGRQPLSEAERSLEDVADWGPAEDWTEWSGAQG